eukprot:4330070-Prymnesium_polylepis.1
MLVLFCLPAVAAVCPHCSGNFASCTYDSDKRCPCVTTVEANAAVVAGAAGALTLPAGCYAAPTTRRLGDGPTTRSSEARSGAQRSTRRTRSTSTLWEAHTTAQASAYLVAAELTSAGFGDFLSIVPGPLCQLCQNYVRYIFVLSRTFCF